MPDYPESLRDFKVDVWPYIDERMEELSELNNFDYEVIFNVDAFEQELEAIEVYALSDDWYKKFGSVYWCGILNLEPWCCIFDNPKYDLVDGEEEIWDVLLKHHMEFNNHSVTFKFNPESRLNGWLRYYSRTDDVATNVRTLFRTAIKHVFSKDERRRESSLWRFEPYIWCKHCGLSFPNELNKCPECSTELVYT